MLVAHDYDADGITSAVQWYHYFAAKGADVWFWSPDRWTEGYGPNPRLFDDAKRLSVAGPLLVLLLDFGTSWQRQSDLEGVTWMGIDHHLHNGETWDGMFNSSLVFPADTEGLPCTSGWTACALSVLKGSTPDTKWLAGVGTVADMVKMSTANATIVQRALKSEQDEECIYNHKRRGEQFGPADERDFGFAIAPAINAGGRLGETAATVTALIAGEFETLKARNTIRKDLSKQCLEAALDSVFLHAACVTALVNERFLGVVGITASELVRRYDVPAFVGCQTDSGLGLIKGSIRTIPPVSVYQSLYLARRNAIKWGGHAGAGGVTVQHWPEWETNWAEACSSLLEHWEQNNDTRYERVVKAVEYMPQHKEAILKYLANNAPFGVGFERPPCFLDMSKWTLALREQYKERHVRLVYAGNSFQGTVHLIAWNMSIRAVKMNASPVFSLDPKKFGSVSWDGVVEEFVDV